jgi:L-lactate dehydrogenase complex protein LldG
MSDQAGGPPVRLAGAEHGDRGAFLGRVAERLAGAVPGGSAHPLPPLGGPVPPVGYRDLDPDDLQGSFVRNATALRTTVHPVAGDQVPAEVLAELVRAERIGRAAVAADPAAAAVGETLAALGVAVEPYRPERANEADLGVSGAVAAVAATGTVVHDAGHSGGRGASLLPRTHLAVAHRRDLVATTGDYLRSLGHGDGPPSNLVLISSASRSGDIEMTLTWGVHGPTSLHVVLLGAFRG